MKKFMTRDEPNTNIGYLKPNGLQEFMFREPFLFEDTVQICLICPEVKEHYWITNHGRVFSTFNNQWMNLNTDVAGYYTVGLQRQDGCQRQYRINRLVGMAFIPFNENYDEFVVNHKDGCKIDNYSYNLEWCTDKENTQHAFYNGLAKGHEGLKGESSTTATHTNEEVDRLCQLISQGLFNDKICEIMGYEYNTNTQLFINGIRRKENWTNVSYKYEFPKLPRIDVPTSSVALTGEDNYNCNFTDDEVHDICKLLVQGKQSIDICKILNYEYTDNMRIYINTLKLKKKRRNITTQYEFPNILTPNIKYTDETIHKICKLIESDVNIPSKDISDKIGYEYNKSFIKYVYKIRNKKLRKDISSQYNF